MRYRLRPLRAYQNIRRQPAVNSSVSFRRRDSVGLNARHLPSGRQPAHAPACASEWRSAVEQLYSQRMRMPIAHKHQPCHSEQIHPTSFDTVKRKPACLSFREWRK